MIFIKKNTVVLTSHTILLTKFEDKKEHFIFKAILNICKSYIFSSNTTVHLQIPAVQKQPFLLLLGLFKGFSHVYPTNPL